MSDAFTAKAVNFFSDPFQFFTDLFTGKGFAGFSGGWLQVWETVRAIIVFIDFVLAIGLIAVFLVSLKYRPNLKPRRGVAKKTFTLRDALLKERWQNVLRKASAGSADALKVAIIDADKIVDDSLKQLGFQGEHMADRLEKILPHEIRSLDRVWQAHRVRNNLVHTPDFVISVHEARKTLDDYQAFLKEVKLLQ